MWKFILQIPYRIKTFMEVKLNPLTCKKFKNFPMIIHKKEAKISNSANIILSKVSKLNAVYTFIH